MSKLCGYFCAVAAFAIVALLIASPLWGAIGVDASVSGDRTSAQTTVSTPGFSTIAGNELLLAFVSADNVSSPNTTVTGVTGAGLTWVLVRRTNVQRGTAEIWRAFAATPLNGVSVTARLSKKAASSITVMSFTGIDTSGIAGSGAIGATGTGNGNPGAPTATLVTTRNGSLVIGAGNDWDHAIPRTVGPGQILVHQNLSPVDDTFWVQMQSAPTVLSGTSVTINDTAPATDRYNLSIVEVLAASGGGGAIFSISGSITGGGGGSTVRLTQAGTTIGTAIADASGNYSFAGVANGTYTVTPSKTGFTFSPTSRTVIVNGANVTVPAFAASSGAPLVYPDLSDIIPPGRMSIVNGPNGRQFQYTHDTLNGGPGPLVIQPVLNTASGTYQGTQYIYSLNSSGVFSLAQTIPIAGAFVFHSEHGHFHFPFASYGLYSVAANGGPGAPVALSPKIGFCIDDSFIYLPNIANAGALGNLGPCSDPTSLRGLNIGAVDEYDQTDDGQSIPLDGIADGIYWLRAIVDPDNFFADADKRNNETDVKISISGNSVQVLETVVPVLNEPPAITLTSPASGGTVSGVVQLTAATAMTSGVQFMVDGQAFGNRVTSAPYTITFDTTTLQNGSHWLAAQTSDATGVIGTSPVAVVTVANSGSSGPVPHLASPASGSILSATVTLSASVASAQPIASVEFFVDAVSVGTVTTPPYLIAWNSTTVPDGPHTIAVRAIDTLGNIGDSAPVTVQVDNSHPAKLIGKDMTISIDGAGTLTTPPFSTNTPGDLLIAFVAYDGPLTEPQMASVNGAGLNWTLLQRSNTQAGTSEIWSARASGTLSFVTVTAQQLVGSGFHGSLTVIAFTNAAGTGVVARTGAPSGEPDIFLPGVIAGDWVFAVGNDWDRAVARTPVSGQVLVHQKVDTQVGDTFWVQSTVAPSVANALVDIHDTAPTTDRWNYAAVEIVATHQ
jgi:hypothetical protein